MLFCLHGTIATCKQYGIECTTKFFHISNYLLIWIFLIVLSLLLLFKLKKIVILFSKKNRICNPLLNAPDLEPLMSM